jgi:hypothetical protein
MNKLRLIVVLTLVLGAASVCRTRGAEESVSLEPPSALVIGVHGSCRVSLDGKHYRKLKPLEVLHEGAVLKTGSSGRIDLYLKRMAVTARLKKNSEIKLGEMERSIQDSSTSYKTMIDVRKGSLLTVARAEAPNSSLTVSNASGRTVIEPNPVGRFLVTADATQAIPPEMRLSPKEDQKFSEQITPFVKEQIEFDEMQALSDAWSSEVKAGAGAQRVE